MSYPLVHHIMQHKGFTKNKDVCTAELKELHSWLKSASNSECLETLPSILISSEECLSHTDRKIRLLLACCLTQVLRIFDQNQPFSSVQNLEIALIFILSQLAQGLQSLDTEEQALSLQLLQYLINIKGFRSTRLIKNGHEILSSMLSVMIPIAEQASVSQRNLILQLIKEVLDDPMMMMELKVLMPIAESIVIGPHSNLGTVLTLRGVEKPSGKAMTELLKYLLENTDPGTRNVTEDKVIPHSLRNIGVFVLVQKLYSINRKLVQPIYPVLAMRLKSLNCDERKECLNVVSNLLIHDDANADHPLFSPFLDRSSDVDVNIRLQTIHAICHLVQVLPKCVTKIINTLHRRTSDPDVVLRCELAAVCTQIMLQNDSALELLLSLRTLSNDEEIKIQMEAICGMVKVYERHLTDHTNLSESNRDYAHIIFNTLMSQHLHTEISTSNHIIENLLYTYIFPNTQSVPKYTEKLLFFLCGANAEAIKKIQFIHEIQKRRKEAVLKWISQRKEERITNINTPFSIEHVEEVSPYFPDDGTKIWCLKALDFVLAVNENCYTSFTTILEENYGTEADTDVVMSQLIDIASLVYSECTIQIPKLRQLLSSLYKGKIATEHIQTNQEKAAVEYLKSLDHCIKTVDDFLDHQKMMQVTIEERFNTACATESDQDHAQMEKLQKHQEMIREQARNLKQEIDNESSSAVTSIIDMAVTLAESSNVNRGVASERLKRECSLLFEQGLPIKSMVECLEDLLDEDFIHSVSSEDLRLEVQRQLMLNRVQLKEYLDSRVSDVTLGHTVHRLLGFKYPRPPPPPGANMPWIPVMALIIGLNDAEVMGNLVEVLSRQQVNVVLLDDAVETCIEAYRKEGPGLPLLESKDPPACTEEPPSVPEVQMLLRHHTLHDEPATATGAGDSSVADKETQTGPEVTPVLSLVASLGKQALETLRLQQPLSDWLKVAVLIEHLKHITNNAGTLGWVLADFPQTFEQAALFESAISGQHVPNPDLKDEEENYSKVTLYQSQIVCDPSAPHSCMQPFKTTLTSVVSVVQSDFERDPEFVSLIEELYLRQRVHSYLHYEQWTPEVMTNLVGLLLASCSNDSSEPPVPSATTVSNAPDFDIPPPLALGLAALWENLEITYLTNLHRSFFSYRAHKQRIDRYIGEVRDKFAEFLARPDDLQGILQKFQDNYQQVPASKRLEVISEMHDHVKTLREALRDVVNLKQKEAENEVRRIAGEPWLSRELGSLLSIATMLIQLELDRFIDTVALLQDYCMTSLQITPPDASKSLRFEVPKTLNTQVTDEWASNMVDTLVSLKEPQTIPDPFTSHLDSLLQGAKAHLEKIIGGIRSSVSKLGTEIKPKPAASKKEKLAKKGKGKKDVAPTIADVKPLEDLEAAMLVSKKLQLLSDWLGTCNSETELTMQRLQLTCDMACSEAKDLIHQVWSSFFLVARDAYDTQCKIDCHSSTVLCEFLEMAVAAGASLEAPLVLPRKSTYLQYLKNPTMCKEFITLAPREEKLAQKLRTLVDILNRISCDGFIHRSAFEYILNQAKTSSYLPSDWSKLSTQDISDIMDLVSPSAITNWKSFMVRLLNLPVATQRQLLMAKTNFLQQDPARRGTITKEQFLSCRLWLEEAFEDKLDCIATKETLFLIFSNATHDVTNYLEFLVSCCHDPNPALGFAKACAVYTGSLVTTGLQSEDDSEMDDLLSEVNLKFPERQTIHLDIAEVVTDGPFTEKQRKKHQKKLNRAFRDAEEASLTVEQRRARQRALATKGKVDEESVSEVVASFLLKNPDLIELVTPFYQTFSMSALVKKFITTSNADGEPTTPVIIQTMEKCLRDPSSCFCYGLNPQTVFQQLANVLKALVEPYGDLFINREELAPLLVFLSPKNDLELISTALKIFSVLGAEKSEFTQSSLPLESRNPELAHCIKNSCEILLFGKEHITLSTSLLKQIINFIHNNLPLSADTILTNYFLMAKEKLEESPKFSYSAYIALLGYLSPWLPLVHRNVLKSTISRKVVKDLLMKSSSTKESLEVTRLKCSTTNLSAEVFCKMLGMKTIYRWLLSTQGEDLIVIGNTLRMLDAFLVHKGDLLDAGDLSDPERAVLRLTAGRCILKICGSENALKQLNPNQIHNLSQLMMDENAEVREKFGSKLYKDLCQGKSSLSSLFLSFLALGVLDPEEHLQQKAMQHIEQFCQSKGQEWDELCLFWLIPLLANAPGQWIVPRDKDSMLGWHPNVSAQQRIRLAMWSIIAPILSPQPNITVARIRHIVQKIKNSEDGMSLDCNSNVRIWVTCDLVTGLLDKYKCTVLKSRIQVDEVSDLSFQLPYHLLRPVDNPDYQNSKVYTNLLFGELPTLPRTQFNSR